MNGEMSLQKAVVLTEGFAGAEASTSPGNAVLDMQVHGLLLVPLNQKLCVSTALQGMLTQAQVWELLA